MVTTLKKLYDLNHECEVNIGEKINKLLGTSDDKSGKFLLL